MSSICSTECWTEQYCQSSRSTIFDTPSPPWHCKTVWTSKPCPACWATSPPGSPWIPTPMSPPRHNGRRRIPWGMYWPSDKSHQQGIIPAGDLSVGSVWEGRFCRDFDVIVDALWHQDGMIECFQSFHSSTLM